MLSVMHPSQNSTRDPTPAPCSALQRSFLRLVRRFQRQYSLHMRSESKHSTGKTAEKQPRGLSQGAGDGKAVRAHAAVTSSVSKPEFKKHIHTNAISTKPDESASSASGAVLSRRQIKNLAKRRKKEAAAACAAGHAASVTSSSLTPNSSDHASSSGGNAPASTKAKKAPLDPGKKAEVNCNWQALKKALVSGGPVITRSGAMPNQRLQLSLLQLCFAADSLLQPHFHASECCLKAQLHRCVSFAQRCPDTRRRRRSRSGTRRRSVCQHQQHRCSGLRNGRRFFLLSPTVTSSVSLTFASSCRRWAGRRKVCAGTRRHRRLERRRDARHVC
jgi:hypothetical protein